MQKCAAFGESENLPGESANTDATPINTAPITFTKKVPHGKSFPQRLAIRRVMACRAIPPNALPSAIQRNAVITQSRFSCD